MNCTKAISLSDNQVVIKVYVIPHSAQSLFPAGYNSWRNCIEIRVQAYAKDNKANKEVIDIVSHYFNIASTDVTILSGHKGREKIISIRKVRKSDVGKKIEASLHGL